jgi:hypothetical protein
MTTIQITLPDQLAREAERAGLLTSETLERILRERLKEERVNELFETMDRMSAIDTPAVMSPEEVAEEMRIMRAERRAAS